MHRSEWEELRAFRQHGYSPFGCRRDSLFELLDALVSAPAVKRRRICAWRRVASAAGAAALTRSTPAPWTWGSSSPGSRRSRWPPTRRGMPSTRASGRAATRDQPCAGLAPHPYRHSQGPPIVVRPSWSAHRGRLDLVLAGAGAVALLQWDGPPAHAAAAAAAAAAAGENANRVAAEQIPSWLRQAPQPPVRRPPHRPSSVSTPAPTPSSAAWPCPTPPSACWYGCGRAAAATPTPRRGPPPAGRADLAPRSP